MASTLRKVKYQPIRLTITGAGLTASTNDARVDQNYDRVKGIQMTCTDANAIEQAYFDKFEMGGKEIYPKYYEGKLIYSGVNVAPNERFDKEVDEPGNNTTVDITLKDQSVAGTVYPYTVTVYLKLENPLK